MERPVAFAGPLAVSAAAGTGGQSQVSTTDGGGWPVRSVCQLRFPGQPWFFVDRASQWPESV